MDIALHVGMSPLLRMACNFIEGKPLDNEETEKTEVAAPEPHEGPEEPPQS